jgi:hypothetical protein
MNHKEATHFALQLKENVADFVEHFVSDNYWTFFNERPTSTGLKSQL